MPIEGRVLWVVDADRPRAHRLALVLAARGAKVLVSGVNERALGECVGEIAHGGGKARHVVSDAASEEAIRACIAAARDRFGSLDAAIALRNLATSLIRVIPLSAAAAAAAAAAADPDADADADADAVAAAL